MSAVSSRFGLLPFLLEKKWGREITLLSGVGIGVTFCPFALESIHRNLRSFV
jgi:hypothetical protein